MSRWTLECRPRLTPGDSVHIAVAPGGATAEVVGVRLERLGDGYRLTWVTHDHEVTCPAAEEPWLTVVVDGSMVEAFCADLAPVTQRVYAEAPEPTWVVRIDTTSEVLARTSLSAWELARPGRPTGGRPGSGCSVRRRRTGRGS